MYRECLDRILLCYELANKTNLITISEIEQHDSGVSYIFNELEIMQRWMSGNNLFKRKSKNKINNVIFGIVINKTKGKMWGKN